MNISCRLWTDIRHLGVRYLIFVRLEGCGVLRTSDIYQKVLKSIFISFRYKCSQHCFSLQRCFTQRCIYSSGDWLNIPNAKVYNKKYKEKNYEFCIFYCILSRLVYLISRLTSTVLAARNSVVTTSNVDLNIFYYIYYFLLYTYMNLQAMTLLFVVTCCNLFVIYFCHLYFSDSRSSCCITKIRCLYWAGKYHFFCPEL